MKKILSLLFLFMLAAIVNAQSYNMVIHLNNDNSGYPNNMITIPIENISEIQVEEDDNLLPFFRESFNLSVTEIISRMIDYKYNLISAKSDVITFINDTDEPTTITFYFNNGTMIGLYSYENVNHNNRIPEFQKWDFRMYKLYSEFPQWKGTNNDLHKEYSIHSEFISSIEQNTENAYEDMYNSSFKMGLRINNDSICFKFHRAEYKLTNEGYILNETGTELILDNCPETQVFVQGQKLFSLGQSTRAGVRSNIKIMDSAGGLRWPLHTEDGWESARFSIRADGTIPDFYDKSYALFYGRPAGKAGVNSRNIGKVYNLYNYPHYNDRDLDYYKVDRITGENIGLFRYIYDPYGLKTQPVIMEAPSVLDILADEKDDLEAEIAAGRSITSAQKKLDDVNGLMAKGADYLDSHVLWYVVKEVAGQYRWHVNGVIRENETPEYVVDPIPDNVEVDVHLKSYEKWNEIKTSIHVRTDVGSVTLNIPLKEEDILEKDDFGIRVYDFYYNEYTIQPYITHDMNGITITITDIPKDFISFLNNHFGDGLTIDVYSYCKKDVWDEMKNSYVRTGKPCNVYGNISSAFHPGENIPICVTR